MSSNGAPNVRARSKRCLENLEAFNDRFSGRSQDIAGKLLQRFNDWIDGIGVLAEYHHSLDYRLREAPKLAGALIDMLEVLEFQIRRGRHVPSCSSAFHFADHPAMIAQEMKSEYPTDDMPVKALVSVDDTLGWLHRFSLIVRNSIARDPFSRAARFTPGESEVKMLAELASALREILAVFSIGSNLTDRLVDAVDLRRKYFLYCQSHQEKLAKRYEEPQHLEVTSLENEEKESEPRLLDSATSFLISSATALEQPTEVTDSATVITDVLDRGGSFPRHQESLPPPSGASTATWLNYTGKVEIPPAPDIGDDMEHRCPYCCLTFEADIFTDDEAWKRHIIKDLRPYVCIHEECPFPEELFSSTRAWREHLRKPHYSEWACPLHSKGKRGVRKSAIEGEKSGVFYKESEFQRHLETNHRGAFSSTQIDVLKRRSLRTVQAVVTCPFCKYEELPNASEADVITGEDIYKHIGEHLVAIALISLPARERLLDENDDKEKSDWHKALGQHSSMEAGNNIQKWLGSKSEPQAQRLNSLEVLELAKSWIAKCIGLDHKCCPGFNLQLNQSPEKATISRSGPHGVIHNLPFYPTRLIELGTVNARTVKLVITNNTSHHDDQGSTKPEGQYVTLSHCWDGARDPFCLKADNVDHFRNSIQLEELPQTFKDAINFARQLGPDVKYIWIDSLCIMQGDEADWLHESAQMCQVYKNSYCNISATGGRDDHQGLYNERIKHSAEGSPGVGPNPSNKDSQRAEAVMQRRNIVDQPSWEQKVEAAPLNTKAWVLQERLLAPRVLHFCEDEIAWECHELDASESAPAGIVGFEPKRGASRGRVRLKSLLGAPNSLEDEAVTTDRAHDNWKRIIARYSVTDLPHPQDKLIALAGIAEQMSTQIEAPYVAGMWTNKYFTSQLLWRVEPQWNDGRFFYTSRRPTNYRAPSFSWAAVDAPEGIRCGETQTEENLLIKVIEVNVQPQPEPNGQFGLVKDGGYIKLECQMLEIAIGLRLRRAKDGDHEDVYTWTLMGGRKGDARMLNVYLDSPEDDFEEIRGSDSSIWLVPAYKNPSGDLICLLLEQKKNNGGHLRRVGLSIIPRFESAEEFMKETSLDKNGQFGNVRKKVIQIF
jgi:Heterokaryon incompatibility protein (HET)